MLRVVLMVILVIVQLSNGLRAQQLPSVKSKVYVIPFSHLDLYWACTQEECLSRGNYIISKAIQLAKDDPSFRFVIPKLCAGFGVRLKA
jgi:hypothetical protein